MITVKKGLLIDIKKFKKEKWVSNIDDHYERNEILGQGQYGKVYRATKKATDTKCAFKVMSKQ